MLITHFSKYIHIQNILLTNELRLEGSNFDEEYQKIYFQARANIRFLWFTEKDICYTAKPTIVDDKQNFIDFVPNVNLFGFQFDSEEIKAAKWIEWYKPVMMFNKKKKVVNELNKLAFERGDDPKNYWVVNENVSLEKCKSVILWRGNGTHKNMNLKELSLVTNFNDL